MGKNRRKAEVGTFGRRRWAGVAITAVALTFTGVAALCWPQKQDDRSITGQNPQIATLTPVEQELMEKFSRLSAEQQESALEEIAQRIHAQTGIGTIYERIIQTAQAEIIAFPEFQQLAQADPCAKRLYDGLVSSNSYRYNYSAEIDKIILPFQQNSVRDLESIFLDRTTRRGWLSHEALHRIQFTSSPNREQLRYLYRMNGLAPDAVSIQMLCELSDQPPENRQLGMDDVRNLMNEYQSHDRERKAVSEVAAFCLTPKVVNGGWIASGALLTSYGFDQELVSSAAQSVFALYGYYSSNHQSDDGVIDTSVNEFIGRSAKSLRHLQARISELVGSNEDMYKNRGVEFLERRSERLNQVPFIAQSVLERYSH